MSLLCIYTNINVMNWLRISKASSHQGSDSPGVFLPSPVMYSVSCDAGVFLIFPEDVSGRVSENNQDTPSSLRWIFNSLLSVLLRCSSDLIPTPGVTTESAQTLAMISVNQQLKVNSRCDQFQYVQKNVLLRMDWDMVLSHPTYHFFYAAPLHHCLQGH